MMMLNEEEIQNLDGEWIELIQMAKTIGLSREEVRTYFQETTHQLITNHN